MGLYDEQLKIRQEHDRRAVSSSLKRLAAAATGRCAGESGSGDGAVREIFDYYGVKMPEVPDLLDGFDARLDFMLDAAGLMRRNVKLSGTWWRDADGPMLAFTAAGDVVALLPGRFGGYAFTDPAGGGSVKAGRKTADVLTGEAICFYRPLPQRALSGRDILRFAAGSLSGFDILFLLASALLASLLGLVMPMLTRLIFQSVIPLGDAGSLLPIAMLAAGAAVSAALLTQTRALSQARIIQKIQTALEHAVMGRLLHLPAGFFKERGAGEISNRVAALSQMCGILGDTVFTGVLGAVFSVVYLFQIRLLAPALAAPALLIFALQMLVIIGGICLQTRVTRRRLQIAAKQSALVFRLFSGIQKIKLAGAERRAFAKWAGTYADAAALNYHPPLFLRILPALSGLIALAGSLLLYAAAAASGMGTADYIAFTASYGMLGGAVLSLSSMIGQIAALKPLAKLADPVMRAVPETGGDRKAIVRMSGGLELTNLSFRYTDDGPWLLDHVNLKIRAGQYIGIVGRTGCGKSTLLRLLLGFETPDGGAVYYDNRDLKTLDPRSVRRQTGVVLQQSRLFPGDIYSNIVISAPHLTLNDAWEAAKLAGVDEDIRRMPMGMQTMITEGSGGISGGQRQRLMIARAIAPRPKLLLFDEATSALDNITQKIVSDSLENLHCTRIAIAHRLSTIRHCDRILVLDGGKIVEDGTYDELLHAGGVFTKLARRQMPET